MAAAGLAAPLPAIAALHDLPRAISSQELRRLEQWIAREFHVPPIVLVENAGRAVADLAVRRFEPTRKDAVIALVGRGVNGAKALAAARHLLQRGFSVSAVTTDVQPKLKDETLRELQMFRKFGGSSPPFTANRTLPEAALIIDGILGYGLTDASKGPAEQMIAAANAHAAEVISIDVPSGLQPDLGTANTEAIEANATLALGLPLEGVVEPEARGHVGELYLGDLGFPRPIYEDYGIKPEDLFGSSSVVRLPAGTP